MRKVPAAVNTVKPRALSRVGEGGIRGAGGCGLAVFLRGPCVNPNPPGRLFFYVVLVFSVWAQTARRARGGLGRAAAG